MIDDEIPTRHIGKRSKVNMPKISAQGKTSDPFRTVNRSIRPIIGNLRLQERVPVDEYLDYVDGLSLWIVKRAGGEEAYDACRSKVGQCRRMKRFAVTAA